jgi:hypothetical protein
MMDDLQLQELIKQICHSPEKSWERGRLMNQLIFELSKDKNLLKSSHFDYLEALNHTWLWLCKDLCKICSKQDLNRKTLLKIINTYLSWRIKDLYIPDKRLVSLDVIVSKDEVITTLLDNVATTNINGIDGYIEGLQLQEMQIISLQFIKYIEKDPDKRLQNTYLKNRPICNCQFLAQKLLLKEPQEKLIKIAGELNISPPTIYSFWQRKCLILLREIAIELGYKAEP